MKRLLIFLVLIITAWSCDRVEDDRSWLDGYEFHDDFYYESDSEDGKYHLTPCLNQHFIRFDANYQTEVINELINRGFQIIQSPVVAEYDYGADFEIPEYIRYGSNVSVKGEGEIDDIPHVIYSHHLYYNGDGEIFGKSNLISLYYDLDKKADQIEMILKYAEKHKVYLLDNDQYSGMVLIACINKSSCNPVELANWFVEAGGFEQAIPDSGYYGNGVFQLN